jgi:hypothetical protein
MRFLLFLFSALLCLYLVACRYNRVSVIVKNNSDSDFKSLTVRFGDTLQLFKDLKKGDRTKRFWSNQTYAKGYTRVVLPTEDTIIYFPINRNGKKMYYHGKILVKVKVVKSKEQPDRDTLQIRTRRRFMF